MIHRRILLVGILACLAGSGLGAGKRTKTLLSESDWSRFLSAVRLVETGGLPDEGENAVGDKGKAIGPFQIWKVYHTDSRIPGEYTECNKMEYSKKVVRAYLTRWAPEGATMETLARIHNGGPAGHRKAATEKYWKKVEKNLDSMNR
jgi:hypothetical protein